MRAHDRRLGDHGVEFLVERLETSEDRRLQGGRHRGGLDGVEVPHPVRGLEQALVDEPLERFLHEQRDPFAGFVEPLEEGGGRGVALQDLGHHLGDGDEGKRAETYPQEVLGLAQEREEPGEGERTPLLPGQGLGLGGSVDDHLPVVPIQEAVEHLQARLVHEVEVVEKEQQRGVLRKQAQEVSHSVEEDAAPLLRSQARPRPIGRAQGGDERP